MFFAVLKDRLEATFGGRTADGMVSEIACHPTEPVGISVLAHKQSHSETTSGYKGQEDILVPEQVESRLGEAFGRHIGVIGVVGQSCIECSDQRLEEFPCHEGHGT
jgi:hypothetical protein